MVLDNFLDPVLGYYPHPAQVCDNETMSEIYAIRFGANTRKFENFWIFELACGPGSRKFENSKLTDVCENLRFFFGENVQFFFCRFCENLCVCVCVCVCVFLLLRKFVDLCDNLPNFAKISDF